MRVAAKDIIMVDWRLTGVERLHALHTYCRRRNDGVPEIYATHYAAITDLLSRENRGSGTGFLVAVVLGKRTQFSQWQGISVDQ